MLRKQAVFDRETFLTLPDLPPRLKLWGRRFPNNDAAEGPNPR